MGNLYTGTPGNDGFSTSIDDTLAGGAGNDSYFLYTQYGYYPVGAVILENPNEGEDIVVWRWRDPALPEGAQQTYVLPANVEVGWAADPWYGTPPFRPVLIGNATNNYLYDVAEGHGGGGDDVLVGIGDAVLRGEDGNDWLSLKTTANGAVVDGGAGIDVMSFADYFVAFGSLTVDLRQQGAAQAIGAGQTLTLIAIEGLIGGNSGDWLIGDGANNQLAGGGGDDTLDGGAGDDTLYGAGIDPALLVGLAGSTSNAFAGNGVPSSRFFQDAHGNADRLDGGLGADLMIADPFAPATFFVDNPGDVAIGSVGVDVVYSKVGFTLDITVENLFLTGIANADGTGSAGNNVISGNVGVNHLDGGAGIDTLSFADAATAVAASLLSGTGSAGEAAGDTYAGFEIVEGSGFNDTLQSGGAGWVLRAKGGDDLVLAGPGAETLDGGEGFDTISYADAATAIIIPYFRGNYDVNAGAAAGDILLGFEALIGSAFNDTIASWPNDAYLGPFYILPVQIDGGAGDDVIGGGYQADTVIGGEGADTLDGGIAGDDILVGGPGNDVLSGGNFTYLPDADVAVFSGNFGDYDVTASYVFRLIVFNSSLDARYVYTIALTLTDLRPGSPDGTDQVEFVERYRFADGERPLAGFVLAGSLANETLPGSAGADTIDGGGGADYISGGDGNDLIRAGAAGEIGYARYLIGEAGNDTLTGTDSSIDVLYGGDGNDSLLAGGGADGAYGGAGDDYVDAGDNVSGNSYGEHATGDDGNDTVIGGADRQTLEGGAGDDSLSAGAGMDTLRGGAGRDTLEGGADADVLEGGNGNDTFILDALDSFSDTGGIDTLVVAFTLTLGADFENLVLTGTGAIDGTGNAADNTITGNDAANLLTGLDGQDSLSGGNGKDTLRGGEGNDTLDGGGLADLLEGGLGDDTYIAVSNDTIVDTGGIDTVMIGTTATLAVGLENLVLTGTAAIAGTGNAADNTITGNRGANLLSGLDGADSLNGDRGDDTLVGGLGADTLAAGKGADTFRYASAAEGADLILGYAGIDDTIEVSAAGFGAGLTAGMDLVAAGRYAQNATGVTTAAQGQFLFNTTTRQLSWDADGTGGGTAVLIADLTGAKAWNGGEIVVIA